MTPPPSRPVPRRVETSAELAGVRSSPLVLRHGSDPAALCPKERVAELGAILEAGYRRLLLRQKSLAESGYGERPCDQAVDGDGARTAEEVA